MKEVLEPTKLEFNDDILSIEYESFSCVLDVNVGLDVDLCAEYEFFSFDPIQTDLLFESCKSKLVEFETIVTEIFDLDWTLVHFDAKRLVDSEPTIMPRPLIPNDTISWQMTCLLAGVKYIHLFPYWAQQFDRLKRPLTSALLLWWMYFFRIQLFTFYYFYVV